MTTLSSFVSSNIPVDIQQGRDFSGSRGWITLVNQLLRRLENEGLITLTQRKETGVEVDNSYWITLPSDYRSELEIIVPGYDSCNYKVTLPFAVLNGKVKLDEPFSKNESPYVFTLSSGGISSVIIDDSDAVEDEWEGYLLKLSNGTYSGDGILIGEHEAASSGYTTLNFLHQRSTNILTSTSGYLTDAFLQLRYMAQFVGLTSSGDTIPVDSRFDNVLINGLCYMAKPVGSDERIIFRQEFENDIQLLKNEIFTPTPEQARPVNRSMAALEDCSNFSNNHTEFVGDQNAWLE
jgi:hypothetical protein